MWGSVFVAGRRRRLERLGRGDPARLWERALHVWARAREVHTRPEGDQVGRHRELLLLQVGVATLPDVEGLLSAGLDDERPTVAGYCLIGLCYLRSERVALLPARLLVRREPLRWVLCGRVIEETLGDRARFESEVARSGMRSISSVALEPPLRREAWDRVRAFADAFGACGRCATGHFDFQRVCPGCGAPISVG